MPTAHCVTETRTSFTGTFSDCCSRGAQFQACLEPFCKAARCSGAGNKEENARCFCNLPGASSQTLIFLLSVSRERGQEGCKCSLPSGSAAASHPVSLHTLPIFTLNNCAQGYQGLPVAIVRGDGASLLKRWTLGSEAKHNSSCCILEFD